MPDRTLSIAELGRLVHAQVASGRYTSASEMVRTALRLLQGRDAKLNGYSVRKNGRTRRSSGQ
jgi:putative addiction module CopG family antidote